MHRTDLDVCCSSHKAISNRTELLLSTKGVPGEESNCTKSEGFYFAMSFIFPTSTLMGVAWETFVYIYIIWYMIYVWTSLAFFVGSFSPWHLTNPWRHWRVRAIRAQSDSRPRPTNLRLIKPQCFHGDRAPDEDDRVKVGDAISLVCPALWLYFLKISILF